MAAYRRVYDSRHLQAGCQKIRISSGTLRSVIEYGLPYPFLLTHLLRYAASKNKEAFYQRSAAARSVCVIGP